MTVVFPLYDDILKQTKEKDLTPTQKKNFSKKVDKLDEAGMRNIYLLIRLYQLNYEDDHPYPPYNAKLNKKDTDSEEIEFNLEDLPIKLKQMLHVFIGKHIKVMEQEKKLTNRKVIPNLDNK